VLAARVRDDRDHQRQGGRLGVRMARPWRTAAP
jgi:hypothetical protein